MVGSISVPFRLETGHFLLTGSPGAGKTTFVKITLCSIVKRIQSLLYPNHRAVILDPKRELYPLLKKIAQDAADTEGRAEAAPIVLLDPLDARSHWWDIAADIDDETDAAAFAAILIPEQGREPFWYEGPRDIVTDVFEGLRLNAEQTGETWYLRDLVVILGDVDLMKYFIRQVEASTSDEYFEVETTTKNLLVSMKAQISQIRTVAAAWDWQRRQKGD